MGSYNFKWEHPANEVYVTGTFDNWTKSEKLVHTGSGFAKDVQLPSTDKVMFKFVVDGNWVTDHTHPSETDQEGNVNNVLYPRDISQSSSTAATAAGVAGVAGVGGAAALASGHDKSAEDNHIPGEFPETPANELNQFSVNPIPATSGAGNPIKLAPGEPVPDPSSYTSNTISSTARDDPSLKTRDEPSGTTGTSASQETPSLSKAGEQVFGVAPIPATGGASNPISLQPGEKVPEPSSYTGHTLGNNVRLDKESYEKGDTSVPYLPPVLSKEEEAEAAGAGMFGIPSAGLTSLIPESSLPMGASSSAAKDAGPTISSAGPGTTTAHLAGQQPLEPRGVPEVVSESQSAAHVDPEAAASSSAVAEKSAVEEELLQKVPEAPSASTSTTTTTLAGQQPLEPRGVPEVVSESQNAANADPEAAASPDAVAEKGQVEDELKQKVPEAPSTSESGAIGKSEKGYLGMAAGGLAAVGSTALGAAYLAKDKAVEATGASGANTTAKDPNEVLAPSEPVNPEVAENKEQVAQEIKDKVPEASSTSESGVLGKSEQGYTGAAAGGLAAAGGAAAGLAYAAKDKIAPTSGSATEQGLGPNDVRGASAPAPEGMLADKAAVTDEIKETVPEAPTTSESGIFGKSENNSGIAGVAAGGVAAAGATAAGAAYLAKDKTVGASGAPAALPASVQDAIKNMNTHPTGETTHETSTTSAVPDIVTESQKEAKVAPEAAASAEAVREKSAMEQELTKEIKPTNATGEPAPTVSAATATSAPVKPTSESAGRVSSTTKDPFATSTGTSGGLNAPASAQAVTPATAAGAIASKPQPSRDVSPMTQPTATTGTESARIPVKSEAAPAPNVPVGSTSAVGTPQKARPGSQLFKDSPSSQKTSGSNASPGGEATKKKRMSFFGKMKEKFSSK